MADTFRNFLAGHQYGTQNRLLGEQEQRRNQFSELAGQAYGASPGQRHNYVQQAVATDPEAGFKLGQNLDADEGRRTRSLVNMARLLTTAPESARPGIYQQMVAPLRRFGLQAPDQYDETVGQTAQSLVQALAFADGNAPAGLREFQAMTQGLSSEDQMRARRINLGLDGRASSAGFSQVKFTGADGRERIGVLNGKTGQIDLPDGTSFNPQTGQIAPTQGEGQQGGQPTIAQGQGQQILDQIAATANQLIAQGVPAEQVDAWAAQQMGGGQVVEGMPTASQQPQVGSNAGAFVGRRAEDEAAAVRAAQNQADLDFLPERQRIETQGAIDRTRGTEQVKAQVEKEAGRSKARLSLEQATARVNRVDALVNSIMPRVGYATAGVGSLTSALPGSPAGDLRRDLGTLQAIAGFDELNAMRASSPTGGALGNVTERELGFLQSVVRNIENSQSPGQLRTNLEEFRREVKGSWERVQRAYEQDYGSSLPPALDYRNGGSAGPAPAGARRRYNPATGRLE